MKHPLAKAAIVCLVVSGLIVLVAPMFLSEGGRHIPPVEWDQVEAMTYGEATKYLLARTERISGWAAFIENSSHLQFWIERFQAWMLLFAFGFFCCALLLRWLRILGAPSNLQVERDA